MDDTSNTPEPIVSDTASMDLTGFDYTAAKAYTNELLEKLAKRGLENIRMPEGGIDPNRQLAYWFLPDERNPAIIANYHGGKYSLMVVASAFDGKWVIRTGCGEDVDLGADGSLESAGVSCDSDIEAIPEINEAYARFNVLAWETESGHSVFNQWDEFSEGAVARIPSTVDEAITFGVLPCLTRLDELDEGLNEDVDDDAEEISELTIDSEATQDDLLAAQLQALTSEIYVGAGGKAYITDLYEAESTLNEVLFGGGADYAEVNKWWINNKRQALEKLLGELPGDRVEWCVDAIMQVSSENLNDESFGIVVGDGFSIMYKLKHRNYGGVSAFDTDPEDVTDSHGHVRTFGASLCNALAYFTDDDGLVRAVAEIAASGGDVDRFMSNVGIYRMANRVCDERVLTLPDDAECVGVLSICDDYTDCVYDGSPLEVMFSRGVDEVSRGLFGFLPIRALELPDGLKTIGSGAFADIVGLCKVFVPNTVTDIGRAAFAYKSGDGQHQNLLVAFEGGEDECRQFADAYSWASNDRVRFAFGVTRGEFRAIGMDECLREDSAAPLLTVDDVPTEVLAPTGKEGKDEYMSELRRRLERCGYANIAFHQDLFPRRQDAEWYCTSGRVDGVLSFDWGDTQVSVSAGGDHVVILDGEEYYDMEELATFGVVDDEGLTGLDDIFGDGDTFEGFCEFSVSLSDSDGFTLTNWDVDADVGCTLEEAINFITDPGNMNWFLNEYREAKAR